MQRKAGANASAVSNTEAYINQFMTEAESFINCSSEYNWSDAFSTLNVDVKGILKMAASCFAAMCVLNFDPSGIPSREFETRIDVLDYMMNKAIAELNKIKVRQFMLASA
ncbi:MAG: hypothetical protein AAB355_00320 [Patescibacteria group bacterium]